MHDFICHVVFAPTAFNCYASIRWVLSLLSVITGSARLDLKLLGSFSEKRLQRTHEEGTSLHRVRAREGQRRSCTNYMSWCCCTTPNESDLKKGGFALAYSPRSYGPSQRWQREQETGWLHCICSQGAEGEQKVGLGCKTPRPVCFEPLPPGSFLLPEDATVFPNSTMTQRPSVRIHQPRLEWWGHILHSDHMLVGLLSAWQNLESPGKREPQVGSCPDWIGLRPSL